MQTWLVSTGKLCIEAACITETLVQVAPPGSPSTGGDAEEALNHLASLQNDGKKLQAEALERQKQSFRRERELAGKVRAMKSLLQNLDSTQSNLSRKKHSAQRAVAETQRHLADSLRKHDVAKEKLERAKSKLLRENAVKEAVAMISATGSIAVSIIGFGAGVFLPTARCSDERVMDAQEKVSESSRRYKTHKSGRACSEMSV